MFKLAFFFDFGSFLLKLLPDIVLQASHVKAVVFLDRPLEVGFLGSQLGRAYIFLFAHFTKSAGF